MNQNILWRIGGAVVLTVSALVGAGARPAAATNLRFGEPAFEQVWTRTDSLVAGGQATRSWYWGPAPGAVVREPYKEAPGGTRLVQYFDKSRMEINNPGGDRSSKFFVTNGLLTVELISGKLAVGNDTYETRPPAAIPLASDGDDPAGPTYVTFSAVSNTPAGDHPADNRLNQNATATINRAGQVGNDPSKAGDASKIAYYEATTKHNVPKIFWTFLNSVGPVRQGGATTQAPLSDPWTFTTGLPISEAYWAQVQIAGKTETVLIQAYERRVLTYIPSYAPAWQVQMNNAGQQYYEWRYGNAAALLTSTLGRMDGAPSYHASSVMELATNGVGVRFATQETDFAGPNKVYLRQNALGTTGQPQISEVVSIGATGYVSATDTIPAHTWNCIRAADVGTDPSALNIAALLGVLQFPRNLQVVGDEQVNNVATVHLRMDLDPQTIPTVRGLSWSAATADVWISKADGLLQQGRVSLTITPGAVRQGALVVTATFRDYGKPVTITAPPVRCP